MHHRVAIVVGELEPARRCVRIARCQAVLVAAILLVRQPERVTDLVLIVIARLPRPQMGGVEAVAIRRALVGEHRPQAAVGHPQVPLFHRTALGVVRLGADLFRIVTSRDLRAVWPPHRCGSEVASVDIETQRLVEEAGGVARAVGGVGLSADDERLERQERDRPDEAQRGVSVRPLIDPGADLIEHRLGHAVGAGTGDEAERHRRAEADEVLDRGRLVDVAELAELIYSVGALGVRRSAEARREPGQQERRERVASDLGGEAHRKISMPQKMPLLAVSRL